jgi:putative sterol carrier protein
VSFYPNSETVCNVMTELFTRTLADPAAQRELRRAGMVFRLDISDPAAAITVDAKSRPAQFLCGADGRRADLVIHTPMDIMHGIWMSEIKLGDAFFGGKLKVEGSKLRAMSLGGLFRRIEALYPGVLRDKGMLKS